MTSTTTGGLAVDEAPASPSWTLADLRKSTGLTQRQVATRMGVNQPRVSQIEKDFPNLHFQVVSSYIAALGGHLALTGIAGHTVPADDVRATPRDAGAQANRRQRSLQGAALLRSAAEELVLQRNQAQPGGDDTGRDVDHPDAESDQSDRAQSQQR